MPICKTRNVPLTTEFETLVDCKVASGRHLSVGEVVRAALRLLDKRERHLDKLPSYLSVTQAAAYAGR